MRKNTYRCADCGATCVSLTLLNHHRTTACVKAKTDSKLNRALHQMEEKDQYHPPKEEDGEGGNVNSTTAQHQRVSPAASPRGEVLSLQGLVRAVSNLNQGVSLSPHLANLQRGGAATSGPSLEGPSHDTAAVQSPRLPIAGRRSDAQPPTAAGGRGSRYSNLLSKVKLNNNNNTWEQQPANNNEENGTGNITSTRRVGDPSGGASISTSVVRRVSGGGGGGGGAVTTTTSTTRRRTSRQKETDDGNNTHGGDDTHQAMEESEETTLQEYDVGNPSGAGVTRVRRVIRRQSKEESSNATATTTTSTTRRSSGAPTTTTIPSGASSSAASAGRRRRQSSDRPASSGEDSDESEANRTTKTATVRKSVMGPGRMTYSPLDGHDGNDSSVVTHTTTVTRTTSGARRRVRRVRRVGADGTVVEEEEVEEALGQGGEQEYGDKTSSSVARRRSGRRSGEENRTVVPMPSTPEGVGRNPRSKERHDDVDELDSNNHSTTAYEPSSPSTGGAGAHPRGRRRSQTRSEADSTASTAASTLRSTATTFDFTTASEAEGGLDTTTASVVGGRSSTLIRVYQTASDENNASRNNNNRRPPRSSSVSYQEDGTEGEEGKERISRSRSKKDDDQLDPHDDNDVVQYSVDSVSTDGARRAGGRRRRSQSNDAPPSPPSTEKIDVPALTTFRSPSATTAHLSVIGDSVDEGNHDDDSSSALSYEDSTSTGGKGRRRSSRRSMQQDGSSGTSTVTVDSHENSHGSHMEHNTHNVESTLTTTTIVMSGGVAVEGNEEEIGMQSFRRRKVAARRTGGRSSTTPQSSSLANTTTTTTTEEATASTHNAVPSADNNDAPESVLIETDNGGVLGLIMDEPQGGPRNNNQNRRRSRKVSDVVSLVMANNHTVAAAAEAGEGATTAPPPPPPPAAVESSTAANESSMVSAEVARGDEEGVLGYSPNEPLANRVRRVMRRKSSTTTSSQPQQQAATEGDSTPPPPPPKALVEETNVTVPPVRQPTPPSVAPTLMSPKQQKLVEMNEDDGGILAIQLDEPQQKPRQQQQRRRSSAKDVAPTTTTAAVASPPVSQFADPVALAAAAPTAQAPPPPPQEKAPAPPPAPLHLSSSNITTPSSPAPATTTGSGSGGANHSHNSSKSPRSSSSVVTLTGTPALNGVGGGGGAHDMPQFTNVAPMTSHPFHHVEVPRLIEEPKVPTPPKETKKSAGVEFATQTDPLETGPLPLAGYPHPPPYGHASHTHSHSSSGVAAAPSHSHSHSHSSSSSNSHHHGAAAAAGGGGAAFPSGTRSSLSLNGGERVGGGFTPSSLQHIHGGGGGGGRQSRVVSIDESTGSNSIFEMHPSPPNSTTASLQRSDVGSGAVPGTLTRRRSLRNTVDFNSLPSIPQPTQGALLGSGERGMRVLLIIDRVIGAPLLSSGTRMFVYVGNDLDESGERGVSPSSPEFYKEARVYAVQQLNSSVADPEFGVELDVVLAARGTVVIVVIECIVKGERTTLGHSLIRLDSNLRAGNYKSRIFVGDPRQSRYQQLNGFKQDAVLDASNTKTRDALARVIRNQDPHQLAYQPCGFVDWRCDSWDLSQPYYGIITEPPVTDYERVFLRERGAWRDYHRTPSNSYKILSNDELTKYMEDKTISYRTDELSAYIVPYNRSRGIFVNVECIRGIAKQKAVYKVIVTVRNGKRWFHGMTEHHDWDGDLGVQHFLDEPFMYTDLDFDPKAEMLFQVYRLEKPSLDNPGPVNLVGWSACSLFYADGFPRTGRFSIPIYDGPPPNFFLAGLKPHPKGKPHRNSQQQEPSLIRATGVREDDFYSPRAVISFTMGDAYRAEEFLPRPIQPYEGRYRLEDTLSVSTSAVAANRPPLQALYIPQTFFSQFPISKSAGILNIPLKDVLPTQLDGTTVDVDAIEEVMNHMLSQHVRRRAPPQ